MPSRGYCDNETDGAQCCQTGEFCSPALSQIYVCDQTPPQCPAQQTGVDFSGDDLALVQAVTQDRCCELCVHVPELLPRRSAGVLPQDGRWHEDQSRERGVGEVAVCKSCSTPARGSCGKSTSVACYPSGFSCEPFPGGLSSYQCLQMSPQCLQQLPDVVCDGAELMSFNANCSSKDCCDFCVTVADCKGYSFTKTATGSTTCSLKRSGASRSVAGSRVATAQLSRRTVSLAVHVRSVLRCHSRV